MLCPEERTGNNRLEAPFFKPYVFTAGTLWFSGNMPEAVRCKRKQQNDWLVSEPKGDISLGPPLHLLCFTEIQPSHLSATHTWDLASKNTGKLGVHGTWA